MLDELRPEAEAARDQLVAAFAAYEAAVKAYKAVDRDVVRLLRPSTAIDGQSIPSVKFTAPLITGNHNHHGQAERIDPDTVPLPLPMEHFLDYRRQVVEHGVAPKTRSLV